jgi:membrane protease YdiL (CAAX protease family)
MNRAKGVVFGFLGFLVLAAVIGVQHGNRFSHFSLPNDPATWLNAILSAPIAEEILFRGLVFRVLLERLPVWSALAVSALLFALVHLPYWWLSGGASPASLAVRLGSIFAYGVFFALLYRWSGSLYAPVLCHVLNNLVTVSMGL